MSAKVGRRPLVALTRTEVFAQQLRALCGLKTPEIAYALGWTESEALEAHLKVKRMESRRCRR